MLTVEQRIYLANSAEFQQLLATDPKLDALSRASLDLSAEFASLSEFVQRPVAIGELKIKPITPYKWSLLWCLGNAFTENITRITETDTAVFLYLLCHDTNTVMNDIPLLAVKANQWCIDHQIDYVNASAKLIGLVVNAFYPLELLPDSKNSDSIQFDSDWLTRLCCIAAEISGHTLQYVIHSMPLSLCFRCLIHHLRKHDHKGLIRKRTNDETAREIVQYTESLGEQFIQQKESGNFIENKHSEVLYGIQ